MLQEMATVKAAVEQREKRERKKLRELKRKARVRCVHVFFQCVCTRVCVRACVT
jgi:hypothetical protein